uniref:Membrane protein m162 n=1 Tax=Mastomys natalensis cytomegalovirus 2 TaxID=2973540 RepID=A0A9Y1IKU7_9BETA|nr:membrane protein m162 [Mastomys natalensis cytomegalovirus 2]WEG69429.1 membrane protein m162 [Mastomys natalensis cytomegalovirus 2]WEG69567.1 membrane protein m162 [Mastomys natalensis cytomegalovirus 2]WEG69705.1 membrane protein m162 [Mastomys natalensis cytomegalovirus 2]WEG71379.1 membrane protein m162 [Mastomys natalensis cytomegalovirus 2]
MTYTGMRLLWLLCLPPVPVSSHLTPTAPDTPVPEVSPTTEPTAESATRDPSPQPAEDTDPPRVANSTPVTAASPVATSTPTSFSSAKTANITHKASPPTYSESTALGISLSMLVLSLALSLLLAVLYAHGVFNHLRRRRWSVGSAKTRGPPPLPPRRVAPRDPDAVQDLCTPLTESCE